MPGVGYHNDQYFNLDNPSSGESGVDMSGANLSGFFVKDADNPKFVYPDRIIRTDDVDGPHARVMRRGYMRSLLTYANHMNIPIKKCQFQFNPSELVQSVSANDSMLTFLQQDPGQYAQPMPSNVNFTFELFFDRSMEINNDKGNIVANPVNPWEQDSPGQVGVLRDLAAFFGVIGQGVSADYLQTVLAQRITLEASSDSTTETPVDPSKAISNIPEFLRINLANSAFLLPLPVRIVFSALYIVEGLVTNTTVTFTKFSTTMVPMQCKLQVTLEAKYIGFAKKDTFLTKALAAAEAEAKAEEQAAANRAQALAAACNSAMGNMDIVVTSGPPGFDRLEHVLQTKNSNTFVWSAFPRVKALGEGNDPINAIFVEGTVQLRIEVNASFWVYGPFDDLSQFRSQTQLIDLATQDKLLYGASSVSSATRYGVATDTKSWDSMSSGTVGPNYKTITGWSGLNGSTPYDFGTSWFIIWANGNVQVSADDNVFSGTGRQLFVVGPGDNSDVKRNVNINWPVISAIPESEASTSATGGYVPPDNAATAPPKAGKPSTIGTVNRNIS